MEPFGPDFRFREAPPAFEDYQRFILEHYDAEEVPSSAFSNSLDRMLRFNCFHSVDNRPRRSMDDFVFTAYLLPRTPRNEELYEHPWNGKKPHYGVLEQLLGEAQAELESAGFATRMVMPDTFCRVRVDVPYFKRVLDNLFANVRKYADPAQPVSIAALPENRTLHICICNTIRADSGQVESNKIGLRTAEKILTQMGGSFRHEAEGKFTAEAILPIVPEDADE